MLFQEEFVNLLNSGSAGSGGGGGGGGAPPAEEQRQVAIHVTEAERDAINRVIFFCSFSCRNLQFESDFF